MVAFLSPPPLASGLRSVESIAREVDRLLAQTTTAIASGDDRQADRLLDRARRLVPSDAGLVLLQAQFLSRLGRHAESLDILGDPAGVDLSPAWGFLLAEAAIATGDFAAAARSLDRQLHRFALESIGWLPGLAAPLLATGTIEWAGWIGLTVDGHLQGAVPNRDRQTITLCDRDGRVVAAGRTDDAGAFDLGSLWTSLSDGATAACPAGPLLGGTAIGRPGFRLEGEISLEADRLVGWARLGWSPATPVTLLIDQGDGVPSRVVVPPSFDDHAIDRPRFALPLVRPESPVGRVTATSLLPDGSTTALAGSPIERMPSPAAPVRPLDTRPPRSDRQTRPSARVTVVVPVYGGRAETEACLASVIRTVDPRSTDIVVVDDASPDRVLSAALDLLAASGRVTLLRNERNQGFPASANRGIAWHPDNDVVLLNADAEVCGDWLDRLRRAAHAGDDIGTVTPLSNAGSIASYPGGRESEIDPESAAAIDFIARRVNRGRTIDLPTGIGFCLYLRRECLDETGMLDAEAFGQGYGEEDDFCLRARRLGWRSVAAPDVFVRHIGAASFGPLRLLRIEHATRRIEQRHPGYLAMVEAFGRSDPLRAARRALDEARLTAPPVPSVLLITLTSTGGTVRHTTEHARTLARAGFRTIVLRPIAERQSEGVCRLVLDPPVLQDLVYRLPEELDHLVGVLRHLGVERIEFHHFFGLAPAVFDLPERLDVPYEARIHDYIWICPRIALVRADGTYCGEPELAGCLDCMRTDGSLLEEPIGPAALRSRSARLLRGAEQVVTASHDAAARLTRHFPGLPVTVEPWETDAVPPPTRRQPDPQGRVRVVSIGAFTQHKGMRVLHDCALDAVARDLPIDYILIGRSADDDLLLGTGRIFITGEFAESEIDRLLARERGHVALFPSIWPETWCYALTPAMRAGLPIVAFDLGAPAERLRGRNLTRLIEPGMPASAINDALLQLASRTADGHNGERGAERGPGTPGPEFIALRREDIVVDDPKSAGASGEKIDLVTNTQILTLGAGLYCFLVRDAVPVPSPDPDLALPALLFSAAPVVAQDGTLDILSAPSMPTPWLTRPGDAIVARVSGNTCHVALTSVTIGKSAPLDIEVRRLDQRPAAAGPEATRIVDGSNRQPAPAIAPAAAAPPQNQVKLQVLTHIQNRGDVPFAGGAWAGFIGQSVWMEAFALAPLDQIGPTAIEYKARTAGGFETPWLSGGVWCGTRGMGVPLVEFAIRLTPEFAATHECEYSGAFFSGNMVGPLKDGASCRSRAPNDPLEAIQIRVYERPGAKAGRRTGRS